MELILNFILKKMKNDFKFKKTFSFIKKNWDKYIKFKSTPFLIFLFIFRF
jgi:hypothetical protein